MLSALRPSMREFSGTTASIKRQALGRLPAVFFATDILEAKGADKGVDVLGVCLDHQDIALANNLTPRAPR